MPTLNVHILISVLEMGSSFLAFLQINNCLSETKIPVIDSVNNDVESKIDLLDPNTETNDLCYKGRKLFTKPMLEHFPASSYTLTWFYHA